MKLTLATVAAALLIPGIANAQVPVAGGLPAKRISIAGLDLHSEAGLDALRAPIRAAARSMCGNAAVVAPSDERSAVRSCVIGAIADGERQIGSALAQAKGSAKLAAVTPPPRAD